MKAIDFAVIFVSRASTSSIPREPLQRETLIHILNTNTQAVFQVCDVAGIMQKDVYTASWFISHHRCSDSSISRILDLVPSGTTNQRRLR